MLKRTFSKLKRSPLKKKPKIIDQEKIDKMKAFFMGIWGKRPHHCTVCGTGLGNEARTYHFHHIVAKQHQKHYNIDITYDESNIIIVCLDCHGGLENGIETPSVKIIKSGLLAKYESHRI